MTPNPIDWNLHPPKAGERPNGRRAKWREGKPTDNAYIEAFNGRFRAECLNTHWFLTLADARKKMEASRRYDNEERPHGAIGDKVPCELQNPDGATSPPSWPSRKTPTSGGPNFGRGSGSKRQ